MALNGDSLRELVILGGFCEGEHIPYFIILIDLLNVGLLLFLDL